MKRLNISQVDTLFANGGYPIEFLLYYANGVKTAGIRAALRELSTPYWPMFGEYRRGQIVSEGYREEASFDAEVSSGEFDPAEPNQAILGRYGHVIPRNMKKLFFLKVIQYTNGTVLLARLNHVAGDGYSYVSFLSALAEMVRHHPGSVPEQKDSFFPEPHHQRTLLRDFELGELALEPLGDTGGSAVVFLEVPKASVREQIQRIAADRDHRVSTNDILAAMVVKRLAAVEDGPVGDDFQLTVPIDVRRAIPEFGPRYFGNGLMFGRIPFRRSEVRDASLDTIAIDIRKGMPDVSRENYVTYLEELESLIRTRQTHRLRTYDPRSGCLVTNLSRLPTDRLDFGSGTPDTVLPLTVGKNSGAVLGDGDRFVLRMEH